jgi:hypothetical protein
MLPFFGLFLLLHSGSARDLEIKMITAAEYRAWAEESLKWAGEATTANERDAYLKTAETWLQSALRSERLSKEPPTTEYEWVLPSFREWRSKRTAQRLD